MALPPLADVADLSARGIDTTDTALTDAMLAVASAVVRRAAKSPILQTTSTVDLTAWGETLLMLPGQPVRSVASVHLDGDELTDWKLLEGTLWRRRGWGQPTDPALVTVTLTHGMPEVPADVLDLVCSLTGAGISAAAEGYATHAGVVAERVDDYSVTYAQGAEAVASVMELPANTRRWLRASFGGGAGMVTYR